MALNVGELYASFGIDSKGLGKQISGIEQQCANIGKSLFKSIASWDLMKMGAAAVGKAISSSINVGKEFEASMSQVAATMGKTVAEMEQEVATVDLAWGTFSGNLSEYAQEMGANTAFTATEAAQALNYMALAGYDTQTSMSMLPNVLNLAAAGSMELATASDMVTDTQTAFGISLERTAQMVDEMAKAASTGNTSVEQLGEAFLTVGGLAQELNGGVVQMADGTTAAVDGLQELEIALTAMANAGVKGTEAGTHMRNMLLKLASPTSDGTKALKAMGVEVFDTEGRMRSLSDIFGDMNTAMANMTQEQKIATIADLFNTRDIASAEALLNAVESDWDSIGESILGAQGAAQQMADTQLDNLAGDVTLLQSAVEGLQISMFQGMNGVLRSAVKSGTKVVTALNKAIKKGLTPETISEVMDVAFDALSEFGGKLGERAIDLTEAFVIIAPNLMKKLSTGLSSALKGLSSRLPNLFNGLVQALPELITGGGEIAASLTDTLFSAISAGINALDGILPRLGPALLTALSNVFVSVGKGIMGVIDTLVNGLMNGFSIEQIADNIKETVGITIDTNVDNGETEAAAEEVETKITDAMAQTFEAIRTALTDGKIGYDVEAGVQAAADVETQLGELAAGIDAWKEAKIAEVQSGGGTEEEMAAQVADIEQQAEAMRTQLEGAQTAFDQYLEQSVEQPTKQAKAAGEALDGVLEGVKEVETQLATAMGNLGADVSENAENPEQTDVISSFVDTILGEVNADEISAKFEGLATAIITGITTGITSLADGAVTVAEKIAELLKTGIESLGSSDVGTNFTNIADAVMTALNTALTAIVSDGLKITQIIADLLTTGLNAVTGENGTGWGTTFDGIADSILTGLTTALNTLLSGAEQLTTIVTGLLTAALDAVTDDDWTSTFNGLASKILGAITGAISSTVETGVKITQTIADFLATAMEKVNNEDWLDAVNTLGQTVLTAIVDSMKAVLSGAGKIVEIVGGLIQTGLDNVKDGSWTDALGTLAGNIFDALIEAIGGVGDAATSIMTTIGNILGTALETIGDDDFGKSVTNLGTTIINGIVAALTKAKGEGVKIFNKLTEIINENLTAENLAAALSNINTFAQNVFDAIITGINGLTNPTDSDFDLVGSILTTVDTLLGTVTSADFANGLGNVAETLITGLGTAIGAALNGAGNIVSGIADFLKNALSAGNISKITVNLGELGTQIITAIGEGIKSAAGGAASLITSIGDLLAAALNPDEITGESLIGNLGGFGQTIIAAISQGISDAGDGIKDVAKAISDALAKVNWKDAGTDLTGMVTGLITELENAVNDNSGDFVSVMNAIGGALGDSVNALIDFADGIVSSLVGFIINSQNWSKLGTFLANLFKGLTEGVDMTMQTIIDHVQGKNTDTDNIAEFILNYTADTEAGEQTISVPTIFKMAGKYDKETEPIAAFLKDLGVLDSYEVDSDGVVVSYELSEDFKTGEGDFDSWLIGELQRRKDLYQEKIDSEDTTLTDEMDIAVTINEDGVTFTNDVEPENLIEDSEGGEVTETITANVETTLGEVTAGEGTGLQDATQDKIDQLIAGQNFASVVDVATSVNVTISDSNAAAIGTELGRDLGSAFSTAISDYLGSATTAAEGLVKGARTGLAGGGGFAYKSGANFGQGFINGMQSKLSGVISKAKQLASEAIRALQDGIKQGSPSKLTMESGGYFGEGFSMGISKSIMDATKSARSMAQSAVNAVNVSGFRVGSASIAGAGAFGGYSPIDYDQLAYAMSQQPAPRLDLDGREVARVNATNTAVAQNGRLNNISLRYGRR